MKQRICLNMIVKNEEVDIVRCLLSVKNIITDWVIVDTGSTDNTKALIQETLKDIPGTLYERPWVNFAHNRTEAIQLVPKDEVDYIFTIDGDEELILPEGYVLPELVSNSFCFKIQYEQTVYKRLALFSSKITTRYEGVVHEVLMSDDPLDLTLLEGPVVKVYPDEQQNTAEKYAEHAKLLQAEFDKDPTNSRTVFYLAQSYRDSLQYEKAFEYYQKRTEMLGWIEEVWFSFYQCGILSAVLNKEQEEVLSWFLKAFHAIPFRAPEAIGRLMMYLNQQELYELSNLIGYKICSKPIETPIPIDSLFVDINWYQWRCEYEFALSCYHLKDLTTAVSIFERLIQSEYTPETMKESIKYFFN